MLSEHTLRCPNCNFFFHLENEKTKAMIRDEMANKTKRKQISERAIFFKIIQETIKLVEELCME
jgi:hypothetical protein